MCKNAQHHYILNGLEMKIKLIPSKDELNLIAAGSTVGYRIIITFAVLLVPKFKLNPVISLAHENALLQGNAKYPLKRVSLEKLSCA